MEQLTVTEKSGGNYILYKLDGVFNAYTAPNAQTKIYEGIKNHNVVLDKAGIIGMDLAAVGIIMAAHNDSSETGHTLYLLSLSNEAEKEINATGFKDLLKIINSVTEVK